MGGAGRPVSEGKTGKRAKVSHLPVRAAGESTQPPVELPSSHDLDAVADGVAAAADHVASLEADAAILRSRIRELGTAVRALAAEARRETSLDEARRARARELTDQLVDLRHEVASLKGQSGAIRLEAQHRSEELQDAVAHARAELAALHRRAASQQAMDNRLRDEVSVLGRELVRLLERPEPQPKPEPKSAPKARPGGGATDDAADETSAGFSGLA
jgi:chromosome segregation ATPase